MSRKIITGAALFGALLVGANVSTFAQAPQTKNTVHKTEKHQAKNSYNKKTTKNISEEQAEAIAVRKFPGKVEESKTENYKGKQVYRFEIEGKNGVERNVWVSITGKIIKVQKEKAEKEKPMKNNNSSKTKMQKSKT